jgi:hypothetical protein
METTAVINHITRAKTSAHCVCSDGDKARRPFVGRYKDNMKFLILLIATLISGLAHANDLTVVASDITCVGKKEMGLLKYRVGIVVKNTGKENLILITLLSR